ncbi:coiled-coil domain-containing protein 28B-like [Panonychus citri]|uniref:coiled-coil domain-containing protein 28B-like n=1 Tax=Panonychus citri TaxID=50023 RepID=UPI002307EFCF|nr:coiled-coil domain-containing protein 28B-like [Panonychus citri]
MVDSTIENSSQANSIKNNSGRKRIKGNLSYRHLYGNPNLRFNGKPPSSSGLINGHESPTHSFITDVADVRQMEQGLLRLLSDFHSGKLQAFGQDITFEKMESVREQQEKLARLHFDLNNQQELQDTEDGRRLAKENMSKLIESLQQLSFSIEQLQSRSTGRTSTFKT